MKVLRVLATLIAISAPALSAPYEVKREVEGPFTFKLFGVDLNKGSSLQRESVLFNDPSCPVLVVKNAMTFDYADRQLRISSATELVLSQAVTALELRHILFDVFGQHMRNLSNTEAKDFSLGPSSLKGTWNLFDDNATSELLTTVTYISRVRLPDGTQWVFNSDNLTAALGTLHLEKKIEDEKPATAPR
jgi:hypothetical protein